mmetsp:Transcript_9431/g.18702  ORF Transcript_9431/g.18702 Transcript_9431/m.18702 type:complete len:256 (-) Transcript_9431:167-934(-)
MTDHGSLRQPRCTTCKDKAGTISRLYSLDSLVEAFFIAFGLSKLDERRPGQHFHPGSILASEVVSFTIPSHNCLKIRQLFNLRSKLFKVRGRIYNSNDTICKFGLISNSCFVICWIQTSGLATHQNSAHFCHEPFWRIDTKNHHRIVANSTKLHKCHSNCPGFFIVSLPCPRFPFGQGSRGWDTLWAACKWYRTLSTNSWSVCEAFRSRIKSHWECTLRCPTIHGASSMTNFSIANSCYVILEHVEPRFTVAEVR